MKCWPILPGTNGLLFPCAPHPQPLSAPMTPLQAPSSSRLSFPPPPPLGLVSGIILLPQCSHSHWSLSLPPTTPTVGKRGRPCPQSQAGPRWPSPTPWGASVESAQGIRVKTRISASFIQRDADTSIRQMTSEKVGLYAVLDKVGQGLVRKQNPHQ